MGGEPNCAVDGMICLEWDFADCWTATGVSGPLQGQAWRSKVSTLTPEKWADADATHNYGRLVRGGHPGAAQASNT